MASPLTVWSSTADGDCSSLSSSYSTARTVAGSTSNTGTTQYIGQQYSGGNYWIQEFFCGFDTSSIGAGATVTLATFSLYPHTDSSTDNFVAQARIFDWGGTLTQDDWRSGDPADSNSLDEYTLVANYATSGGWSGAAYKSLTSESAFLTNVAVAGTTYLVCNSDKQVAGTAPTRDEYIRFYSADDATGGGGTDRDPKLYVEYSEGSSDFTGMTVLTPLVGG